MLVVEEFYFINLFLEVPTWVQATHTGAAMILTLLSNHIAFLPISHTSFKITNLQRPSRVPRANAFLRWT
jgi:hypothetical protein